MNERRSVNSEVGEVGRGHVIKSKKKKKRFFFRGDVGMWEFPGSSVG